MALWLAFVWLLFQFPTFPGPGMTSTLTPISLVDHNKAQQAGSAAATTGSMNTTGANRGVVDLSCFAGTGAFTDSKSNTWTALTSSGGGGGSVTNQLFYSLNPTVGTGHTVTITSGAFFCSVTVAFFANGANPAFDVQTTGGDSGGSSTAMGAPIITPSQANSLIVASGAYATNTNVASSVNSGFTLTDAVTDTNGNGVGSALAYLVETTATAKTPVFTLSLGSKWGAGNAVFK